MSRHADDLATQLLGLLRRRGMVERRWCVIVNVNTGPPKTVDVHIGGSTVLTSGLRYNGSVTAPLAGETWALDVVDANLVAVYKLA